MKLLYKLLLCSLLLTVTTSSWASCDDVYCGQWQNPQFGVEWVIRLSEDPNWRYELVYQKLNQSLKEHGRQIGEVVGRFNYFSPGKYVGKSNYGTEWADCTHTLASEIRIVVECHPSYHKDPQTHTLLRIGSPPKLKSELKSEDPVYCVRDNAVPIWGNIGWITFESSCEIYCKKPQVNCGDIRQVTEVEYYRIQACYQGGKSTANCLGILSDKNEIFGLREAAKQLVELETVAAEAYQRYGLQILTLLSEMDELSSGVVNRQVSLDYAENKLWVYLAKAQVKLRNYNLAVDKFESIQVEADSDIQAYKRKYYNFLVNIGDTLADMINDSEEQIYATREDNDDLLSKLWHSSMDRYIFMVEAENSLLEYAQLKITSEHPQTYYLESVIQANSTLAEIYRFLQMISSDDSIESIKESLQKAKFALNEMTVAIGKGRGILESHRYTIERRVSKEVARAAVDSYSASFGNESDMKLILDEILNYFFSLYETGETGIDNFEQWWSNIALKLELLTDQRLKLQQQRFQISKTMLLE